MHKAYQTVPTNLLVKLVKKMKTGIMCIARRLLVKNAERRYIYPDYSSW